MTDEVIGYLDELQNYYQKLRIYSFRIVRPPAPASWVGMYATGIVSRVMALNLGFKTLILSENYYCATHLIRLQLDNYLRFYALWLVKDPEFVAFQIYKGVKQLNQIAYKKDKTYTDTYLAKEASKSHNWVYPLYEELCGYVHFSNTHILKPIEVLNESYGLIGITAVETDFRISDESRIKRIRTMKDISQLICELLESACVDREKNAKTNSETTRSDIPVPISFEPMIRFRYTYQGEVFDAEYQLLDMPEGDVFRVEFRLGDAVLISYDGTENSEGKTVWNQEIWHRSHIPLPKEMIQAIGEGIQASLIRPS